jgi:pSer/pThr/pTyr-binding forkhead associated (FHA) protein
MRAAAHARAARVRGQASYPAPAFACHTLPPVPASPVDPSGVSPVELQERILADRAGEPYLLMRNSDGEQLIVSLRNVPSQLTIGRAEGCDVCLSWDSGVSRAHAQLERLGKHDWMLVDDGLSHNGSIVNGERLRQRRRLDDGDMLRFGQTSVLFRAPRPQDQSTVTVMLGASTIELTPAQRRVLVALCRPFREGSKFPTPASNRDIAEELVVSVEAVKTQMRALFERFEVGPLARDAKRARLVHRAFETGVITQRDLED